MKTNDILFYSTLLIMLAGEIVFFIVIIRKQKKLINDIKDKMDGNALGIDDIQEWDMGILESERPFISGHYRGD